MRKSWSESEVEAAVADYFHMLELELTGRKYNKSAHRRALLTQLNNRTHGSVEMKHQNISAVLIEMGVPYINGYKPRFNYQRSLLPEAVSDHLRKNPQMQELFIKDSDILPGIPDVEEILSILEDPPKPDGYETSQIEPLRVCSPVAINYLEREARNQALGEAGEELIMNYERARLLYAGKESLADRVEQISATSGPVEGYDIRSFEESGEDRFIEVKTTKYGKSTPFFVTPNEIEFSRKNHANYHLYRLFLFRKAPRLYALSGPIDKQCNLIPTEFKASPS